MTDIPSRLNAALAGRYRIERELGEGGMATVYLADDLKHERKVALKVLRPELAAVMGAERFLSEIKTTANLQHPHILPLFDSGEADGFLFYVMPLVEGESLRERLKRDVQLSVEEAVRIARSVAGALQAAHDAGVIHRDIKPENILMSRGEPLVSDFGIALAVSQAGAGRLTETGLSLGTPYYMSPEQATADRDPGRASDVYSLGCVLYEMLVGDPPHTGSSAQAVLAKILTEEPRAVTQIRRTVPAHVADAVAKSLERLPADRFESADMFARALADPGFRHTLPGTATATVEMEAPGEREAAAPPPSPRKRHRAALALPWAVTGLTAVAAAVGWMRGGGVEPAGPVQLIMDMGPEEFTGSVVVSPDGRMFGTRGLNGSRSIWVRSAEEPAWRELDGTAVQGFGGDFTFSPDGRRLAYADGRTLKTISASGGNPITLVSDGGSPIYEPHWGMTNEIVFAGETGIFRVPGNGGAVDTLAAGVTAGYPHILPDGSGILYGTFGSGAGQSIAVVDTKTDSSWTLVAEGVRPIYLESGHILYGHPDGGLLAQTFDVRSKEVSGAPLPVLDAVPAWAISLSSNGTLIYQSGARRFGRGDTRFLIVDLDGALDTLRMPEREMYNPALSPDGGRLAFTLYGRNGEDVQIYTYDVERRSGPTQLTFEGRNSGPRWSPDGTRLVYTARPEGGRLQLYTHSVDAGTPAEPLIEGPMTGSLAVLDWFAEDGLAYYVFDPTSGTDGDLWTASVSGDGEPAVFLRTDFDESAIDVSPDARWAAYLSNETGTREVYVRAFPSGLGQRRVSEGGGTLPRWSPDGRKLYFRRNGPGSAPDTLMVVDITLEPSFALSTPTPVWTGEFYGFDVFPDGGRVVLAEAVAAADSGEDEDDPARIVVVLNWFEELKARLGEGS